MLELIFQGFIEWIYSLVLDCWNWLSSSLLDIMSLDLAYIKSHVPIMTDIMQVLLAVGWALLLGNLVFQAMKGMAAGLGFEAEDPKMLFGRSAVFSFLLLASPQLCEIVLDMTSRIITLLKLPNAVNVHLVDASILGNLLAGWLVVIICNFIIMWKVLKLLLKIAEQYVVLSTLTIAAPLAFSMGGSKSTAPIFTGWCRMYGSMCLLMVSNVMFFKMLLSVMSAIPSGLDVIPWMVLIFSIVKVAKRMDDTITRIGLNPAQTGASGGRSLPGMLAATIMHGAVSQVTKTIGGAIGGAAGNVVKGAAGAGTAAAGAAATGLGGLGSILRPGRGRNTSQQSNNQQVHNQQGGGQQPAAQQSSPSQAFRQGAGQADSSQQNTFVQNGGSSSNVSSQSSQRVGGTRHSRKSSVPHGTHRAPSYVPPASGGTPGADSSRTVENGGPVAAPQGSTPRSGGFGGGGRGGGFGTGPSGSFGGGSRGGGFGGGSRSRNSSDGTAEHTTAERSQSGAAGTTASPAAGGSLSRGGASGGMAARSRTGSSGSFGGGSRGGGFGSSRTGSGGSRSGSFGGGSRSRNSSDGTADHTPTERSQSGTAGSAAPPAAGERQSRGRTFGGSGTFHPGVAGTNQPSQSANGVSAVSSAPGTASAEKPGAAGTGASTPATRSTRYQAGEKAVRQRAAEPGKAAAVPGKGAAPGQSAPGGSTETRSTRREKVHSERTTVEHTSRRTSEQSGTVGTPPTVPARPPGKVIPPAAGVSPPKRQGSSPAQQETRRTSVSGRPQGTAASPADAAGTTPKASTASIKRQQSGAAQQERSKSPAPTAPSATSAHSGMRPGPAGTAPDRSRASEKGRTARDQTKREKGKETGQGMKPPGKRPGIGSVPPASKPQSGAKPPDRSGHGGGAGHGG